MRIFERYVAFFVLIPTYIMYVQRKIDLSSSDGVKNLPPNPPIRPPVTRPPRASRFSHLDEMLTMIAAAPLSLYVFDTCQ